jgi:hypothetical protein
MRYKILNIPYMAIKNAFELAGMQPAEEDEVWNVCWGLGK